MFKKDTFSDNAFNDSLLDIYSPAQNQFDLELWYKVISFTDSCRIDIAINDSG